ncbi:MAG: glycosyltransferase family 2 protein [Saprospiraceae bacterium]|nr:glycosyltransferase family 2 protein [Saprospiraceae bacterium]
MPKVSVVMSCYNEIGHASRAVESILSQSFTDYEFIIIDDGSTDGTRRILESYHAKDKRIKFFINPQNIGLAASLNKGIKNAEGLYIARMDADDMAFSDRLRLQVEYLDENPETDILGSNAQMIKGKRTWISNVPLIHNEIKAFAFSQTTIIHPTVMIRRSCFKRDEYDPNLPWAEDKDLWLRWMDKFTFANLIHPLIEYRVKDKVTWTIFYYNHLVLFRNIQRQKVLLKKLPALFKSVAVHLYKIILS